jgi:hypothetical protein
VPSPRSMLHAALEVEVVMDLLDGGVVREAIEKLQGPDGRLDRIRCGVLHSLSLES